MLLGNLNISIIQCIGKMATGPSSLSREDLTSLDHDDFNTTRNELVGSGDTDARANDTDVRMKVLVQFRELGMRGVGFGVDPDRLSFTRSEHTMLG